MKIVRNKNAKVPPNIVSFQVSPEMTRIDVKNYLEKIYNVPVMNVKTKIVTGRTYRSPHIQTQELFKDDDIKYAYVTVVNINPSNLSSRSQGSKIILIYNKLRFSI